MKAKIVLNVDDNEDDQFLLRRAFQKSGLSLSLQTVTDGEKAIEYLGGLAAYADRTAFPWPDFVLLDLKMPRKNGFDVLEWMERELPVKPPVAIFSSSQNTEDIARAYGLGATWYLAKPVEYIELAHLIQRIGGWLENPGGTGLAASTYYRPFTKTLPLNPNGSPSHS